MIKVLGGVINNLKKHEFLFEELVKRDFKQKYKRTILGMGWSIVSPLLNMLVLNFIFGYFFGRNVEYFPIYLLCGNLLFAYFRESTTGGMSALLANAGIFTKINVPKYLFLLSKNVSGFINFCLTLMILMIFVLCNRLPIGLHLLALAFPVICIVLFNIGVGLMLSAWHVFYRDIQYLYDVFCMLLMYGSAIFYPITIVPDRYQFVFYCNPLFVYIQYFRQIILKQCIPSLELHFLCLLYACLALGIGSWIYRKYNKQFIYYV